MAGAHKAPQALCAVRTRATCPWLSAWLCVPLVTVVRETWLARSVPTKWLHHIVRASAPRERALIPRACVGHKLLRRVLPGAVPAQPSACDPQMPACEHFM